MKRIGRSAVGNSANAGDRTMKMKLILGTALVSCVALSTLATPTLAQDFYGPRHYGYGYHPYYDYAPVPYWQARRFQGGPVSPPDVDRGGPGPRVGAGNGMGEGSTR
jgi:hypothetical protein